MKNIIKVFSLLSIFAVITGSFAATSRVSMVNKASSRLPSIAGYIVAGNVNSTGVVNNGTGNAAYLDNTECIDKYTDCAKADDVCGSDFEECTTRVLFHGQMAKCLSVLYQCQPGGITALFGTNNISALSTGEIRNTHGDITDYTYPTSGSVLGQLISGAAISNKFTTEQCVKSYTRCLQREGNCGADFELCTDQKSFKKQALLCDSTLQRCQSEGKIQLFGSVTNADSLTLGGRVKTMQEEGASLAAMNAVKTCQKVTDNCLISACVKNPLRCVEGVSLGTIYAADVVSGGADVSSTQNMGVVALPGINNDGQYVENYLEAQTGSDIRKMLKAQCLETIGTNRYCHMTYREKAPSNKDLVDIDLQEDVFSLAYAARKDAANTKIQEELKKFDTKAKDACYETIKSCAMRSCGGGIGSVCYKLARNGSTDGSVHVNNNKLYNEINVGCAAIVNADANCIYAATSDGANGYQYAYTDASTFTSLFPDSSSTADPIGAVGKLNKLLADSYNDAAIENMKKQCQGVALSCVKSMCGKDYVNCYRNRTDILISDSSAYNTGNGRLDRSMNKVGGILDYNIVVGLCMNNIKNSSVCEEHLKVATAEWRSTQDNASWGTGDNRAGSVREAWLGANTTGINQNASSNSVVIACSASNTTIGDGIDCSGTMEPINGSCAGVMDEDGCVYDQAVTQSMSEYALTNGAETLFQTLLVDVEKEVQAKYNAKLTKEQNVCLANNNGGIMGSNGENGSAFMWVKLKGNKIPKNYQMKGLQTKDFIASNDLYGSFCRMRVTVLSDDKDIQDNLGEDAVAYFAVGDAFTCGSWISQETLEKISESVGERARKEAGEGSDKDKWTRTWATVAPGLAGIVGGGVLADNLQRKGASLGGLMGGDGVSATKDKNKAAEQCLTKADEARSKYYESVGQTDDAKKLSSFSKAVSLANEAKTQARKAGADVDTIQFGVANAYLSSVNTGYKWKDGLTQIDFKGLSNKTLPNGINNDDIIWYNNVKIAAGNVARILAVQPSSGTDSRATALVDDLRNINSICSDNVGKVADAPKLKNWCGVMVDSYLSGSLIETYNTVGTAEELQENEAGQKLVEGLQKLEEECGKISQEKNESSIGTTIAGAAIGGLGLGLLGNRIAWSAQQTAYEEAENKAIKEWMDEIGSHIQCYVGTNEVGTYGEPVLLEID